MIKTILALDMATKTGWASWNNGTIESGVQDFSLKRGESRGMRYLRFEAWLKEITGLIGQWDLVVYEQAHHRGGAATEVALGFKTRLEAFIAELDFEPEVMPVHSTSIKKHATGKGNAGKDAVLQAACDRGWDPIDDNEADALWMLDFVLIDLKIEDVS